MSFIMTIADNLLVLEIYRFIEANIWVETKVALLKRYELLESCS